MSIRKAIADSTFDAIYNSHGRASEQEATAGTVAALDALIDILDGVGPEMTVSDFLDAFDTDSVADAPAVEDETVTDASDIFPPAPVVETEDEVESEPVVEAAPVTEDDAA